MPCSTLQNPTLHPVTHSSVCRLVRSSYSLKNNTWYKHKPWMCMSRQPAEQSYACSTPQSTHSVQAVPCRMHCLTLQMLPYPSTEQRGEVRSHFMDLAS